MNMCFACGADTPNTLCEPCERAAMRNIEKSLGDPSEQNDDLALVEADLENE